MSVNRISRLTPPTGSTYDLVGMSVPFANGTGTASSQNNYAKWEASISSITELYDGLVIGYKIPVNGDGLYGTCLQINSLGYHPVVIAGNNMVSTRYSVGSTVLLMYQSAISSAVYNNSETPSTVSGCWVVVNGYDSGIYIDSDGDLCQI